MQGEGVGRQKKGTEMERINGKLTQAQWQQPQQQRIQNDGAEKRGKSDKIILVCKFGRRSGFSMRRGRWRYKKRREGPRYMMTRRKLGGGCILER